MGRSGLILFFFFVAQLLLVTSLPSRPCVLARPSWSSLLPMLLLSARVSLNVSRYNCVREHIEWYRLLTHSFLLIILDYAMVKSNSKPGFYTTTRRMIYWFVSPLCSFPRPTCTTSQATTWVIMELFLLLFYSSSSVPRYRLVTGNTLRRSRRIWLWRVTDWGWLIIHCTDRAWYRLR